MYLSRIQLNPTNRDVWRIHLSNPYKIHQLVMRGFPDDTNREQAQVLHRLELRHNTPVLMVQSVIEPDWSTVEPAYLIPPDPFDPWPNPAVKAVTLPLQAGQVLGFRLCANPTIKKSRRNENGERRNSNRVPLLKEEQQQSWLNNRAERSGFTVLAAAISQNRQQKIWKQKGAAPITLYSVQFDGYLRVEQPEKFETALLTGIGPSKAFGCGLLSLAPAY
jgi:CRISPR system Cascade subunit CasE